MNKHATAIIIFLVYASISSCGLVQFDDGPLFAEVSADDRTGRVIIFMPDGAKFPSLFPPSIQLNDNEPVRISPGAYHDYKVQPGIYIIRLNAKMASAQNIIIEVSAGEVAYIKTWFTFKQIYKPKQDRDIRKTRKQYSNIEIVENLTLNGKTFIAKNNKQSNIISIINSTTGETNIIKSNNYFNAGNYIITLNHEQLIDNNMVRFPPQTLKLSVKENCAYIINTIRPEHYSVKFKPKEYCLH